MLEINLLPVREARRKEDLRQLLMLSTFMLLLVGAAIGFIHSNLSEEISLSNGRIHQMQRDIDQYKPQLDQVAAFRAKKSELENKIGVIEELDQARSGPVRLLSELASRTPERLWLTSLSTKGSVKSEESVWQSRCSTLGNTHMLKSGHFSTCLPTP